MFSKHVEIASYDTFTVWLRTKPTHRRPIDRIASRLASNLVGLGDVLPSVARPSAFVREFGPVDMSPIAAHRLTLSGYTNSISTYLGYFRGDFVQNCITLTHK